MRRNLDLAVVACEMDPAKQASQIEDFVTQRVDAMLAAPCDSSAIVPYLERPRVRGIPVFTADIAARGGKVVSHVASDNLEGGRLAARTLAERLGGKGDVIIIDHPEVASVQDRTRGFDEEMTKYPGIQRRGTAISERTAGAGDGRHGGHAAGAPRPQAASSASTTTRRSARSPSSRRPSANDLVIVGFDATAEAQDAIRRGSALKADVAQHPSEIGVTAIRRDRGPPGETARGQGHRGAGERRDG